MPETLIKRLKRFGAVLFTAASIAPAYAADADWGIAIHGGAGTLLRGDMTPEKEASYHAKLAEATEAGYAILEKNGSAMDAVIAAIRILEDSPLFNAGIGAVFTYDGHHELDASLMDGATREAGSVASVRHIRNPIELARLVMTASPHVMLVGEGALDFAVAEGFPEEDLLTKQAKQTWRKWLQEQPRASQSKANSENHDTIGLLAMDSKGNLRIRIASRPEIGIYVDNTCSGFPITKWPHRNGSRPIQQLRRRRRRHKHQSINDDVPTCWPNPPGTCCVRIVPRGIESTRATPP